MDVKPEVGSLDFYKLLALRYSFDWRSVSTELDKFTTQMHCGINRGDSPFSTLAENLYVMAEWQPKGYDNPQEWEKSEPVVAVIAAVTFIVFFLLVKSQLVVFADVIVAAATFIGAWLGVSQSFLSMWAIIGGLLLVFIALIIGVSQEITTPIHEWIHHEINQHYELNPEYTTQKFLFMENPGVIPVTTRITLKENSVSALGPFVLIGVFAGGLMLVTDGVLAALLAFVLLVNSASSAGDLYNVWRYIRMPRGTLFANFEVGDGEYRTEYAVPEYE